MGARRTDAADSNGVGAFLKDVRRARGMSLRAVEKATGGGVSNAYLSQLENGAIANPSAAMLHRLAQVYSLDYETLLNRGGIAAAPSRPDSVAATPHKGPRPTASGRREEELFGELTADEERQLLQYLAFLRR